MASKLLSKKHQVNKKRRWKRKQAKKIVTKKSILFKSFEDMKPKVIPKKEVLKTFPGGQFIQQTKVVGKLIFYRVFPEDTFEYILAEEKYQEAKRIEFRKNLLKRKFKE